MDWTWAARRCRSDSLRAVPVWMRMGMLLGLAAGAEGLDHLNPAAVGHRQVQDDHVRMGADGEFDAAAAVGGWQHLEAFEEQGLGQQLQQGGFVFDDQDRLDLLAARICRFGGSRQ